AGQQVYVTGDLLLYYVDGDPRRFVVPDAFVVKGVDPGRRGIYKLWEEGKVPNMVLETTSRSTRDKDTREKPKLYSRLGIPEYFQYDPTGDYLDPPICGYRLNAGRYRKIQPDSLGRIASEELDLWLEVDSNGDLVLRDRVTGRILQTPEEAAVAALDTATAAIDAAEAKNRQLEIELAALRALLKGQ
ncbi:MAG: Uma2 family endonuclease, partial [Planctomycetota bacterium]|nr:Uma2 family endonuclease [Planctomycetota bacterium]